MSPAQLRALDLGVRLSRELVADAREVVDKHPADAVIARNRRRRIRRLRAQLEAALEATAAE